MTKTLKVRKGPASSASKFSLGTKKKGNDGNMWKIVQNKNGTKRWLKISNKSNNITSKKSVKIKQNKSTLDNKMIWGKLGSVYSPKKKHYLRLGTSESFNVIRDELVRDKEWYKRVKFMTKRGGVFGDKLKTLL
tara:strand:- start:267 stop:668 length:402 start_codon:yes stop_codon:yes gene_type:complete